MAPPQQMISPPTRAMPGPGTATQCRTCPVLDPDGTSALEENAIDLSPAHDLQVGPVLDRVQVGPCRAQAPAPVQVAVEAGETLLLVPVHVVRQRVAGLLDGLEEGLEQRRRGRAPLHHQGSCGPAVVVPAFQAGLHALEVRQAVGVVPGLHAGVGRPALVVHRVAPLEDHPVDAAGPAEHLASGVVDPPVAHVGLGLGLVLPVVEPVPDRERECSGHVDVDVPQRVGPAGLEHEDPGRPIGAQAVGQHAPRRTTADDDVVVLRHRVRSRAACGGSCRGRASRRRSPRSRRPARHVGP